MSLIPSIATIPEEQRILIDAARDFAREVLLPLDRKWDRGEGDVAEVLPHLCEMGLLNLCLPEELNGLGCSSRLYSAILHDVSYWSPSTCVTLSVHNMVGKVLARYLEEPLRTELLSAFGEPENFSAFAISEAESGSDARSAKASARAVADGYRVSGEKMWITNGLTARWFLALVKLEGAPAGEDLCAMLIDGQQKGLERTPINGKMGIRGSETAVLHFNDVFVPESHLLAPPGEGLRVCSYTLNDGRVGIAAQASGISEACLVEMTAYARQRQQFGQPIGRFQAVANMIADSATELDASKVLIWKAACQLDATGGDRFSSSAAKLYSTEAANRIAYRAVQVHGGAGYVNECRVEQLFRDARITTIYEGTSEIQRRILAQELSKSA
jgi:alkylation response protein AidB-like acyl-CoA dehydrogenase